MIDLDLEPTAPCSSSISCSFAGEMIVEARIALWMLPTGKWRRELRQRLSEIEGAVETWGRAEPDDDARKQVTAAALDLFSEILDSE
jgi:hypothetical protein